jgi:hypothetical protein
MIDERMPIARGSIGSSSAGHEGYWTVATSDTIGDGSSRTVLASTTGAKLCGGAEGATLATEAAGGGGGGGIADTRAAGTGGGTDGRLARGGTGGGVVIRGAAIAGTGGGAGRETRAGGIDARGGVTGVGLVATSFGTGGAFGTGMPTAVVRAGAGGRLLRNGLGAIDGGGGRYDGSRFCTSRT